MKYRPGVQMPYFLAMYEYDNNIIESICPRRFLKFDINVDGKFLLHVTIYTHPFIQDRKGRNHTSLCLCMLT